MIRFLLVLAFGVFSVCGCAQMCEFGKVGDAPGLECHRVFAKADIGMMKEEVEKSLGAPQKRQVDVSYRGNTYEEVWVYKTEPPTVLYFKNGILAEKEYQQ